MVLSAAVWTLIQAGFVAGHPVRSLAMVYRVDESTIREKAKRFGWQRDPKGDARGSAPRPPTQTKADGQQGSARTPKSGSERRSRADRQAAKQQRFDALVALLDIAQSQPLVGDAAAGERRAQALKALAAEGGMAAAIRKASGLMRSLAMAHVPSPAPDTET